MCNPIRDDNSYPTRMDIIQPAWITGQAGQEICLRFAGQEHERILTYEAKGWEQKWNIWKDNDYLKHEAKVKN